MQRRLLLTSGLTCTLIVMTMWLLRPVQATSTVLPCSSNIQDCLNAANPGDTVDVVVPAVYIQSLTLAKPVSLTASVPGVIIQASPNNRVLSVSGSAISRSVIISGVTLLGGSLPDGSGGGVHIDNGAQIQFINVAITGNIAARGGGVYVTEDSVFTQTGGTIAANRAEDGGGVYVYSGRAVLQDTLIQSNVALTNGGGLFIAFGQAEVSNSNLSNNQATNNHGGGAYVFGLTAAYHQTGGTLYNNRATNGNGGGVGVGFGAAQLKDVSVDNNQARYGGGLYGYYGPLTVNGGQLSNNSASSSGGGLYAQTGTIAMTDTQVLTNSASSNGGGLYLNSGMAPLNNVTFNNNQASYGGGAYTQYGTLIFNGGQLTSNRASGGNGGGLYSGYQTSMYHTVVADNSTTSSSGSDTGWGGGIYQSGNFTGTALTIRANKAYNRGGGIYHTNGAAELNQTTFTGNTASSAGGGFYSSGSVVINTGYFFDNRGSAGGGLYLSGQSWLNGTRFISNTANSQGGALRSSGTTNISNCTFDRNVALQDESSGGHIFAYGTLHLNHTLLTHGTADFGGALRSYGDTTITASSFVFNTAHGSFGEGGAIRNSGQLHLINTTLAYNNADTAGGALFSTDGSAELINDTLDHNSALSGGGLFANNPIDLANSIVTNGDCAGTIDDHGHNLQYPTAMCGASIPTIDPRLGVLGDYGDGTYGYGLQLSSPARDTADAALCPGTDQRGSARPVGPGCDIGALEGPDGDARINAVPLPSNASQPDVTTNIQQVKWYVLNVPEPGSDITVTLSTLTEDFDLFLFAPAINERTGQLLQDWHYLLNPDGTLVESAPGFIGITEGVPVVSPEGVSTITADGAGGNPGAWLDQWQDARNRPNVCFTQNIGQLGNSAQSGGIGSLLCLSAQSGLTTELVALNSRELYGPFYVAVTGHNVFTTGLPYTLTTQVLPHVDPSYDVVDYSIAITFTELLSNTNVYGAVKTLILYQPDRMNQIYGVTETTALSEKISLLAAHPQVQGHVIDLTSYAEIRRAYAYLALQPDRPQAANIVATQIKLLLYNLRNSYPNVEYLVLTGGDSIIPYRRIRDEALFSNERRYAELSASPALSQALAARYFLSDDYYANAALYPLVWHGRELYLPQLGTGRLVEAPSDIIATIDAFIARPILTPTNALVTGYDFLLDQAQAISATLRQRGLTNIDGLINDTWTASELRGKLIGLPQAPDLNALNAHFTHYALIPASVPVSPTLSDYLFATEITTTTQYSDTLVLSVGCHGGLNVPDEVTIANATDWAQALNRQGAAFIGNTGYGYGSGETIALSEKLINNVVDEFGYVGGGAQRVNNLPTLGGAVLQAKQRYFNASGPSGFSNYDEKVLGQLVLYGLPMQAVQLPNPSPLPGSARPLRRLTAATAVEPISLTFLYSGISQATGTYYTLTNQAAPDLQVAGARPIQPRSSLDMQVTDAIAHGVLMVGGTFHDMPGFDPALARIITDELYANLALEPTFTENEWYPAQVGVINRFWRHNQQSQDRLVMVPGQFKPDLAASTPTRTIGTQRLYSSLQFEVYRSPLSETDYVAPSIWQVEALTTTFSLQFRVNTTDAYTVTRVIVLYRQLSNFSWTKVELVYNATTGYAEMTVPLPAGPIEYFAQAVDAAGNVALALDHGQPFTSIKLGLPNKVHLPLIRRS